MSTPVRGAGPGGAAAAKAPLYWRLLRLRHVHPNSWQRLVLVEGSVVVGVLLALAGAATAWAVLVLPVAVAAVVKGHDALAGQLRSPRPAGVSPGGRDRPRRSSAAQIAARTSATSRSIHTPDSKY